MKKGNSKYLILILVGLLSFITLFLFLIEILENKGTFSYSSLMEDLVISFPFAVLISYIDYTLVHQINRSPFFNRHRVLRVVFEAFLVAFLAALFVFFGNLPFIYQDNIVDYITSINYGGALVASILINVFIVTVIEFFEQYRKREILEQENAHMQYLQLKSQINPHFLFNGLNALVSLIHIDSNRAVDYTKKLSGVYRYVLTYDQKETVTVGEELEFIHNYIDILKIRFGAGLHVDISVLDTDLRASLPPMSLQLLIENAVKHNALIASNALHIQIASDGKELIVTNNLIPRTRVEKGLGIGLKNLQEKYQIIANKPITIENNEKSFIVRLPLL